MANNAAAPKSQRAMLPSLPEARLKEASSVVAVVALWKSLGLLPSARASRGECDSKEINDRAVCFGGTGAS